MIKPSEIMDAVEELLGERFPGEPVYRNLTPTGFERPSFLLTYGPVKMQDAGCETLEVAAQLTVTAFVAVDEYHNSHTDELLRRMTCVQELFAVEGLRTGDRVLHVTGTTGICNFDYAEVAVTLQYQDDRPGSGGAWPLAGDMELNINVKEET